MEDYTKAYTEVYYAINNFDESLKSKIPEEFLTYVKNRMNLKYTPIDSEISEEAKAILSVVYSEYLCSADEKKKWDELDRLFQKSQETSGVKVIEYNKKEESKTENLELAVVNKKNKLYSLFEKIKNVFKSLWRK